MPRGWWLSLTAGNLVPIVGVLLLGWEVGVVLILFWIQNGIVGLANIVKIAAAGGPIEPPRGIGRTFRLAGVVGSADAPTPALRIANAWSFAFNYGGFWLFHGLFVMLIASGLLFDPAPLPSDLSAWVPPLSPSVWLGAATLGVLALADLVGWFRAGMHRTTSCVAQSNEPYRRVIPLHVAIVVGSALVLAMGQALALIVVLVVVKTGIELGLEARVRSA